MVKCIDYWVPVKGHEDKYSFSYSRKIRSWGYYAKRWPNGEVYLKTAQMLNPKANKKGYLYVCLCNNSGKYPVNYVHRLVAEAFIPNPNNYPEVNHKNGIKTDNRVENLEWCSRRQNVVHAFKNGLMNTSKGEKHYLAKLTEKQVIEIKARLLQGYKSAILEKEYGVGQTTISRIKLKKTWKHVIV